MQQGCEGPFGSSRGYVCLAPNASAEMVLISPVGENLLDFLELRQVLSTYDGYLRVPLAFQVESASS